MSTNNSIITDYSSTDDAAVVRLEDGKLILQTVDFFTPIVDDPYTFGQISAANSLSDIYAMGGKPLFALNIVGFPIQELSNDILSDIMQGGADKAAEAGIPIVGGHSVDDNEPKYGLVVTGEAIDKEIEREGMETLLSDKDNRIHEMEMEGAKASTRIKHLEPKLEKTEEMYTREKARLGRVFEVAEELDEALQTAQVELTARDDWYVQHMQLFENLNQAIQTRYEMIDSAIEKSAEFAKKQETFKSRMDEALDAAEEAVAHAKEMEEELPEDSED